MFRHHSHNHKLIFSVFQGEVGPPGKSGQEGGLGPLGSAGPRGIAVSGKMVGNLLSFKNVQVDASSGSYFSDVFYVFSFQYLVCVLKWICFSSP